MESLDLGNTAGNNYVLDCSCGTLTISNAGYNQIFRTNIDGVIVATAYTLFADCKTLLVANLPANAMIDSFIFVLETLSAHYMTAGGWVDSGVVNQYRAIKELDDRVTALEGE